MDDSNDEFEPLFDYSRIQPVGVICLDDDNLDESPVVRPKKRKPLDSKKEKKDQVEIAKDVTVIDCDDDEEEDWLPPPPKKLDSCINFEEDSTLKALRLKRQELASFAQSTDEVIRAVEESERKDFSASLQSSPKSIAKQPAPEREKLVISIQDKSGHKQFRVFMDDTFERLFKLYAERMTLDMNNLVFSFDGDKISPSATPASLEMEDNDIIEVHVKAS
ncbi:uncharacterized protein LOC127260570 [Andrographis paniculata]|uniref:uncharacterized protein LOC127260570 n=1 Tax=Andrographis paniculata TaxID=175694 RepID=UPI0021E8FD59|nr:uncharacterized protein LOC127260570 [Andrographis paniculata]